MDYKLEGNYDISFLLLNTLPTMMPYSPFKISIWIVDFGFLLFEWIE